MVMADYFVHDRLQELWQQISHLHLTYLVTEDSPQKIEQRNKLEGCIRDYLCLAPHNRKFCCPETAEVLHRSAGNTKDFSGYRAALGWNAISMYAGNLLSQPWRKEYRIIKTYSGFYKHQIEANLAGAEAMFEAMGYKYIGNGVLVLEGPVCPDRVTNVSQDSIVAFVECQILKTIWEEVGNNFTISWLEVLEFRESHLCSPEQSIRMLNYRFYERRYQEQQNRNYSQGTDNYSTVPNYGVTLSNQPIASHTQPIATMHSFPPHTEPAHMSGNHQGYTQVNHTHQPIAMLGGSMSSQLSTGSVNHSQIGMGGVSHSQLGSGGVVHNQLGTGGVSHGVNHNQVGLSTPNYHMGVNMNHVGHVSGNHVEHNHVMDNYGHRHSHYGPVGHVPCPTQCIYGNPYYNYSTYAPVVPYPRYGAIPYPVCAPKTCNGYCYPNGCVPGPTYVCPVPTGQLIELENCQNGIYDTPDGKRQHDYLESHKQLAKSTNLDSLTLSKSKEDGAGTFESWDYVYRSLESQGYSKDLGERGDLLQTEKKKRDKKTKPSIELEDAFNSLNLGNSNENVKPSEVLKKYSPDSKESKVTQSSSYDSISDKKINGVSKTKTLPRERLNVVSPEKPNQTLDTKKLKKDSDKPKNSKKLSLSWNCNTCTYLNSPSVEICVICGKSKKLVEVTMAVGGSQCPRCTLVNPKECNNCQACDTSLLNSPTYI